ncbi:drug resistance transporter, EmrB/QacA subfamily [Streptomyces sp. DvalAA-14]|uniref:MFS transporter n=1 Tax=unclassified Streptomyces TaxID=2593676 RepID=UPI00081AFAAD|nr:MULTISPECIES: MFS transporter [unclassified Streptomyces]MYS21390.1 DHA2 family efflux MFS transporter permease subunit [Streptomyces sp. SID4948]SCD91341.1 drug resistance transporter, EmrB/QacA subfamily [Streptomyces sp. DvalAA-14]
MPDSEPDAPVPHGSHASDPAPAPSGRRGTRHAPPEANRWWTLTAVCLGTFMLLLDITIVNVALPDIQDVLHASFSDLQWVVDAYALTLAALLLTAGSLADMYGRRLLYMIGLVIFTVASLLCGLANDILMLQLWRGLQGIGGSIMFSVSLALLAEAFRGKDRGTAFAVWGTIIGLAVSIGPLLGGVLTTGLSWRWIFFVNLPIGAVAVVITLLKVAETRHPQARRPDWPGFVLFTAALSSLVYALIESSRKSFSNPVVIACLAGAVVLGAGFVLVESRSRQPMFDLSLFRKPTFSGGLVAAFGLSASLLSLLLYLVLYVQDVLGFSALGTGVRLLVISGGILVMSTISGRLSSKIPVRFLIGPGLLLVGGGLLWMRGLDASSQWTHLIPGMIVSGSGLGLVNPPLASTAVGVVQPAHAGMASGINSTFRQIGIATGIALLGTLFSSKIKSFVTGHIDSIPGLRGRSSQISTAIQSGTVQQTLATLPARDRGPVRQLTASAFTSGLNEIFLVGAIIALAAGVISFATIRTKDFAQQPS